MSGADIDDSFNAAPPPAAAKPTLEDILATLAFSAPVETPTKKGPRMRSSAPVRNTNTLALLKDSSRELWEKGFSLREWPEGSSKWSLTKWELVPEKITIQRREAREMSRATDADINVPCPEGMSYLGYQRAGIAFGHERQAVLIGDEMGLGKTIQAIGIMNANPELVRILIICPASLKINWMRELTKWLVKKRTIFIADSQIFPELANGIIIINYDVLHKHEDEIKGTDWDLVVCDEAHLLKNPKAKRTRMVVGARASSKEKQKGMADIPGITAKKRIFLTGTPIANKPIELFPLISYLDPVRWSSFWKYAQRYCGASQDNGWNCDGAQNLGELQDILRSSIMVRRLKKDVLKELPPKTRKVVEIPADGTTRALIKQEREVYNEDEMHSAETAVELAKADDNPEAYKQAVAHLKVRLERKFEDLSTARRMLAVAKANMPSVHELLDEALEESPKLIIFCHHKEVVQILANKFGSAAVLIVGDTAMPDRQAACDRFQKDPSCKVIIGSFGAMGVGWTLTASSHVICFELDWVPGNVSQAEDRAHRIGQQDNVLVEHWVIEGSLDCIMAKRIISKQNVIDQALDKITDQTEASVPAPASGGTAATPNMLEIEAAKMTQDQRNAAITAIRQLDMMCDGAARVDGAGFNKLDTAIGKKLANADHLSPKQCALARKIALKYQRQLPTALVERMKGTNGTP